MENQVLYFTAPRRVELRTEPCPPPGEGEVIVRVIASAISPGTEMLIYRGQIPPGLAADETLEALSGALAYPLKYGYSAVGEVVKIGQSIPANWLGRKVFAFQPHQRCFTTSVETLYPIPNGTKVEAALFLPNMETAVNFLLDGAPRIGEKVAVLGQGIVGLLTTALLSKFPLEKLLVYDAFPKRRKVALELGAGAALDPNAANALEQGRAYLEATKFYDGTDLTYEVSGNPQALDLALELTGFAGRVVIGSWYGKKRAAINLGGRFHRSRIHLIASQVSTIAPADTGRWDKSRRMDTAWEMLPAISPERLITHHFPFTHAAEGYRLLDEHPEEAIQVILTYE